MECTGIFKDAAVDFQTGKLNVTFTINESSVRQEIDNIKDVEKLAIKVVKYRRKRSLEANGYLWQLCDKIADKLGGKTTKEDVYREAVKAVGVFDTVLIQDKALDSFVSYWNSQGLGNLAEVLYQSKKVEGCTAVRTYYGSHTYDTKQMSRLIDYIVEEAKEQGIETMTTAELERLVGAWGKN